MSAKKLANSFQRSQIVMPRPPYRGKFSTLGFVQRSRMAVQLPYSGVSLPLLACPCLVIVSPFRQPQLRVLPLVRLTVGTKASLPHSQTQRQIILRDTLVWRSVASMTVKRPKTRPVKFFR